MRLRPEPSHTQLANIILLTLTGIVPKPIRPRLSLCPHLLSVSYFNEPACSLEIEYGHGTYKFDEPDRVLDIAAAFGAPAWDAEKKADAKAKSGHAFADLSNCEGVSEVDSSN